MPYVTASTNKRWFSKSTLVLPSGKVETYQEGTALNSTYTVYRKDKSKGKMILVAGKRWSPVRSYVRVGYAIDYTPGATKYSSHGGVRTWEGYPAPSAIWQPNQDASPLSSGEFSLSDWRPSMSSNMLNRIKTGLLVKAGRRQVNYGEALAESRSTLKMLSSAASRLFRAYKAARQGRFWTVAKLLKRPRLKFPSGTSVSRKWLAYQYGWLPLMNDIYDSYQLFKKGLDSRLQVLSVSRTISDQSQVSGSRGNFKETFSRASCRYSGKMFYRVADNDLSYLQQLGLINPLEVAWAVVPFSFVVDWFLPVGNFLEALSARVGLTFIDGYYGVKTEIVSSASRLERNLTGQTRLGPSTTVVRSYYSGYRRTKMTSMPWPGLFIKSPFSTTHVASALALLRTLRR